MTNISHGCVKTQINLVRLGKYSTMTPGRSKQANTRQKGNTANIQDEQ